MSNGDEPPGGSDAKTLIVEQIKNIQQMAP
jgi:hypothetical protein